jgi:exodeoxyribonuclease VII small subunit
MMADNNLQDASNISNISDLTYEQAFSELEQIVSDLESDERSLENALALFERGQALARYCARLLDQAELKVQQIVGDELAGFDVEP